MSRGLWFVAGAGAGVYAVVRGRRAAEALTVDGLTDRLHGVAVGWRIFREEVVAGRDEKETELRHRLAAARPGRAVLAGPDPDDPEAHHPAPHEQEESTT